MKFKIGAIPSIKLCLSCSLFNYPFLKSLIKQPLNYLSLDTKLVPTIKGKWVHP